MCVFCKIINKEIPTNAIFESERVLAFRDINPKATTHILIVPKEHIVSIKELTEENAHIACDLLLTAKEIAQKQDLAGYKLVFNVGAEGGQTIDHLHLHLLAGNDIKLP